MQFSAPLTGYSFLNNPRTGNHFRVFIHLEFKKMFLINHKCGLSYYEHLFTDNFYAEPRYIDQKEILEIEGWWLAVQHEELVRFLKQYDETEFEKIMITRSPYDRLVSFYTNTFWDHADKPTYTEPTKAGKNGRSYSEAYRWVYGRQYDYALKLVAQRQFNKSFELFLENFFINPTQGAIARSQLNQGYGDEHLAPQSAIYQDKEITGIQFIDIDDGPPEGDKEFQILDFLAMDNTIIRPVNRSSASRRRKVVPSVRHFPNYALPTINEFYKDDFEMGYEMHLTNGA